MCETKCNTIYLENHTQSLYLTIVSIAAKLPRTVTRPVYQDLSIYFKNPSTDHFNYTERGRTGQRVWLFETTFTRLGKFCN